MGHGVVSKAEPATDMTALYAVPGRFRFDSLTVQYHPVQPSQSRQPCLGALPQLPARRKGPCAFEFDPGALSSSLVPRAATTDESGSRHGHAVFKAFAFWRLAFSVNKMRS